MGKRFFGGIVLAVLVYAQGAAPCEHLLTKSPARLPPRGVKFTRNYSKIPHPSTLEQSYLKQILSKSTVFPITNGKISWAVVFDPDPQSLNQGYYLEGDLDGDAFHLRSVRHVRRNEQMEYYRHVAELNHLMPLRMQLRQPMAGCRTVDVEGWARAKLWLKHRLNPDEVREALDSPLYGPERDRGHGMGEVRYAVMGTTRSGKVLRVILAEHEHCPMFLVTAYQDQAY